MDHHFLRLRCNTSLIGGTEFDGEQPDKRCLLNFNLIRLIMLMIFSGESDEKLGLYEAKMTRNVIKSLVFSLKY